MHDLLFENQEFLEDADLLNYARQIGLDEVRFIAQMQHKTHRERLRESLANGKSLGVHGTPTFSINSQFYDNDEGLWHADALLEATKKAAFR